jgi:hypothetical protein
LLGLAASTIACGLLSASPAATPVVSTIVAATLQAMTAPASTSASPPSSAGNSFSADGVSVVIPAGVASGAIAESVPAVTDQSGAPWDVAPAYVRLTLQGYILQDKFFQPQIMVYPAAEYAAAGNGAANSIPRLQAILASPSAPMTNDVLPRLPYVNAEQAIGAAPKIVAFSTAAWCACVAEYAQYFAPINNHELLYHYEGLTTDGKSYVVATLPINSAFLAAESDPASIVPAGGVPFPGMDNADPEAFSAYYQAVADLLVATPPDAFQPTLTDLDSLIQSMQVSR